MTGHDGRYRLSDMPPGNYTVAVWHERLGTQESRLTVAPTATVDATFTLTAPR